MNCVKSIKHSALSKLPTPRLLDKVAFLTILLNRSWATRSRLSVSKLCCSQDSVNSGCNKVHTFFLNVSWSTWNVTKRLYDSQHSLNNKSYMLQQLFHESVSYGLDVAFHLATGKKRVECTKNVVNIRQPSRLDKGSISKDLANLIIHSFLKASF